MVCIFFSHGHNIYIVQQNAANELSDQVKKLEENRAEVHLDALATQRQACEGALTVLSCRRIVFFVGG
jgi:hypothetical protein